jgi:hypothetical protein
MPRGLTDFAKRFHGRTVEDDFDEIPRCEYCGRKMKIQARSKPHHVAGMEENYNIIKVYRRCGNKSCPGSQVPPISPADKYALTGYDVDFEVMAEICELRHKHRLTDKEIVEHMHEEHDIDICSSNVGLILKTYEIGCSQKYKPEVIKKLKEKDGIIMTLDAMEPLKGEPSVYLARDYNADVTLGSKQLPNRKVETIKNWLLGIKKRIDTELGVPIRAIVIDAQKELVKAAECVFPGVLIITCEFHFYTLILKSPMNADSHLLTIIRSMLRSLGDIKAFKAHHQDQAKNAEPTKLCEDILEVIFALSNWTRKPRDPEFSGLALRDRVEDIQTFIRDVLVETSSTILTDAERKVLTRVSKHVDECLASTKNAARGLERVKKHVDSIVSILDADSESKEVGLQRLRTLAGDVAKDVSENKRMKFEKEFANAFSKFVETRGERLFNHRLVPGAPRTNNRHELEHMHRKHDLRRTIGHAAASYYLLQHGERLFFVKPKESRENIKAILQTMDVTEARKIIASERKSRASLSIIMHVPDKWNGKMAALREKLSNLKRAVNKTS